MAEKTEAAIFEKQNDLIAATIAVRKAGFKIVDCYTPYPVHGIEKAMGIGRSWMGWAMFVLAMTGATFAMGAQIWIHAMDWPTVYGGKPFNSWPAFVPITFELGVLFAGVGTVITLLAVSKLWPGNDPHDMPDGSVVRDRFGIVAEHGGKPEELKKIYTDHGAERVL